MSNTKRNNLSEGCLGALIIDKHKMLLVLACFDLLSQLGKVPVMLLLPMFIA